MRSILITLVLSLIMFGTVFSADGPFSSGSKQIGGGLSYTYQGGDAYNDINHLIVNPGLGFFVGEGKVIGFEVLYEHYSRVNRSDENFFGLGMFYQMLFNTSAFNMETGSKAFPYIKVLARATKGENSYKLFSFGGQAGFVYMLSRSVGLDTGVQFRYDRINFGRSISGKTLGVTVGIATYLF